MKKVFLLVLVSCTVFVVAGRAQGSKEGAPVTVTALPQAAVPGQQIIISGAIVVDNKAQPVSIKVVKPDGKPEQMGATTDPKGLFTKTYLNTKLQGWYGVFVSAADGKGMGTDSFFVGTPQAVADEYKSKMNALQNLANKNIDVVLGHLMKLPSDAQMENARQKLKDAKTKLDGCKKKTDALSAGFSRIVQELGNVPEAAAALQVHYKELDNWQQEAGAKIPVLENQLSSYENISYNCETINTLVEVCGLISWIMNFQGKFTKIMINIASDKMLPGAVDRMKISGNETAKETKKLAVNESQKAMTAAALGFDELKDFVTKGLAVDVAQYIGKILYAQRCIDLKGPVKARFVANIFNGADKYWTYAIETTGTLVLRYEKNADLSKPSIITGEFEGFRTKYEFWEDIEKVEKFPRGAMVRKIYKSPIPVNASAIGTDLGLAGRTAVPGSFLVKVKGKLSGNSLTLEVQNSLFDNMETEEKNKLHLIMVNPVLPIPIIKTFDFPIARNRAIFVVGLGQGQTIPVQKNGSTLSVRHKMTNSREPDPEIKLASTLDINLTNQ